ncbi:hypothetical protein [Paraburkholderia sp. MM5477-R1]|uniref:hypothetical protein n=1 Tax=Paraburkholderia sp. MM5477-R1 TaxID=2991062 RepID=UPI003D1D53CB
MTTYNDDDGTWVSAGFIGARPTLGAFMPHHAPAASVTVFWAAKAAMEPFVRFIEQIERRFAGSRLKAYGPTRESMRPIGGHLSPLLRDGGALARFNAYRAEFNSEDGEVVVWANVTEVVQSDSDEVGDNIGMTVPRSLFNEVRPILTDAIVDTANRGITKEFVSAGLDDISDDLNIQR